MHRSAAALALCSLLAAQGTAQPAAADVLQADQAAGPAAQPWAYAGDRLVRVTPESGERLGRVLELSRHVWSERVGRGPIEVQVSAGAYATMQAEGFEMQVLIEDVQAAVDAERARIDFRAGLLADDPALARGGDAIDFSTYYPYEDLIAFVNQLAAERPDLVSVQSIGTSIQDREIWTMTITGPGDAAGRPDVAFNSLIHAREWITGPTTLYTAERLVRGYGVDPRITSLLDSVRVHITPVMNPDGYVYSWNTERYWRKNRRDNGGGIFGVDLNRNWDVNFAGNGASADPLSDIYHGPNAFSEPESAAMRDFLTALPDLRAHVDTHSYSQLVLHSPGTFAQSVPDEAELAQVAAGITQSMLDAFGAFYVPQRALDLYEAAGTFSDWSYDAFRALTFTFELRPNGGAGLNGFSPEDFYIRPTAEEVSQAYLYLAERSATPLRFLLSPPESLRPGEPADVTFSLARGVNQPSSVVRVFARGSAAAAFTEQAVTPLGDDRYTFSLSSDACGNAAEFYIEALTTQGETASFPSRGADAAIAVPVTADTVVFADSFNTDQGWTVTNDADLTDGQWERAVPVDEGTRGEPFADAERTGWAYVTDNASGNADVDGGATTLTSPVIDATGGDLGVLKFSLWLDNTRGGNPQEDALRYELSNDGGATWIPAGQIGPDGLLAAGGWVEQTLIIDTIAPRTDTMRVRFIAEDLGGGSVVEAGVDAVRLTLTNACPPSDCLADVNDDGLLDGGDFFAWVNAFSTSDPAADQNGDNVIDGGDFFAWVNNFSLGCD
ncbi:MAG: M14 family zinc carboxypeptidase [Planctomycetota bacterium]